jgi:hypothetical protein
MDEDSQRGNEIVPEDKNKELSLPREIVQRGLELAIRIEQKQGIQQIPRPARGDYTVRCHLAIMEWIRQGDGSHKLSESDKSITNLPVYLVLSVDQDGLHISCADKNLGFTGMEGNEDRYCLLTTFNNLDPFLIPVSSLGLFYKLTHPMDDSFTSMGPLSHLPKDALKNLSFKMGPSGGQPGYKGPVTKATNPFFDITRDCVETVIIYISMSTDSNMNRSLVSKNPPLKLSIVVINQKGAEDLVASRELYQTILEVKDPDSAQRMYVNIGELYGNIPANVTQEKDWKRWMDTYEGRYIKEKGRFDGVSIHPHAGKLFFIVTLASGEDSVEKKPRQVALLVEDAHQMELGEKEGSFLLEGTKWIRLSETYAFKGRVSKFSLFDRELRNTDFKDLVIMRTRLKDIQ